MKLRKKLISLGLAAALIATPIGSVFEDFGVHVNLTTLAATDKTTNAEKNHIIKNEADLNWACNDPDGGGTYTIESDVTVTKSIDVTNKVILVNASNNNVITTTSDIARIFYVHGGSLTLGKSTTDTCRVVVRGGTLQGQAYIKTAPIVINSGTVTLNNAWVWCSKKVAVRVTGRGTLIMNGGEIKKISNTNRQSGAVLLSPNSNSTFEMNGGKIYDCTVGGVMVGSTCTFTMNDGTISGNSYGAGNPDVTPNLENDVAFTGYGGGVYNAGTFNMNGGTITGNSATKHGGGVYNVGTFNMNGGTVSNNIQGGIFNVGSFSMRNGTISGNTTYSGVYNTSYFAMSGGTITGNVNNSECVGHGVFNTGANAVMEVAGSPYVDSNNEVAIYNTAKLKQTGPLTHTPTMSVRSDNVALGATIVETYDAGSNCVNFFNPLGLPAGYFLAGDGYRIAVSNNVTLSYDFDGDGQVAEGDSLSLPYNTPYTIRTYEEVLNKQLAKSQYYDLDPEYMRLSDGSKIAYGTTINVTGDVLLTAIWTPKKYTVTYDYNGGQNRNGETSHSIDTDYDKGFTVDFDNVPVREGYEFAGWATTKDAKEATYTAQKSEKNYYENVTLYAVWKTQEVIITYETGSGTAIKATVGTTENLPVITAEVPEWEEHKFAGWYDEDGNKQNAGNTMKKSTTLTAKWIDANVVWNVKVAQTSSSKIKLTPSDKSTATTYTKLKKKLVMTVVGTRTTSEGTTNAVIQYQIVDKGNQYEMKESAWNNAEDGKITISDHKDCRIYIRAISDGNSAIYMSNGFSIDTKAPTISGVKNGKIYKKAVTIKVSDKVSGVKKITLNGKKIKSGTVVKKNGVYKLVAVDKSGHKKTIRFAIKK